MKRSAASIQPGSGTQPARRKITQGERVPAAAAFRRAPSVSFDVTKRQPGNVGHFGGGVARTAIGHDHLAEQPGGRSPALAPPAFGTNVRSDS
ncbi:MAG: hypothetical protein WDN48_05585 [Pseudolabrys sp.]